MKKNTRLFFWIAGAAAIVCLQAVCGGWLEVRGARPDLVAALVVGAGLLAGWQAGAVAGLAAGWCALALTPGHSWYWPALYAGAGGVTGLISHPFSRGSWQWHVLLVMLACAALGAVVCALGTPEGRVLPTWQEWRGWLLPSCLYSGAAALPVFAVVQRAWRHAG